MVYIDSVSALKELGSFELVLDCFAPPLSLDGFNPALNTLAAPDSTWVCFCRPVGQLGSCKIAPECAARFWHEVVEEISALLAKSSVLPQPVKLLAFRFNFVTDGWVVQWVGEVPEHLAADRRVCAAGCRHSWTGRRERWRGIPDKAWVSVPKTIWWWAMYAICNKIKVCRAATQYYPLLSGLVIFHGHRHRHIQIVHVLKCGYK